eukprot:15474880-Alexandrium_andersonii.AAC.2
MGGRRQCLARRCLWLVARRTCVARCSRSTAEAVLAGQHRFDYDPECSSTTPLCLRATSRDAIVRMNSKIRPQGSLLPSRWTLPLVLVLCGGGLQRHVQLQGCTLARLVV